MSKASKLKAFLPTNPLLYVAFVFVLALELGVFAASQSLVDQEISKVAGLLLTVAGILVGLASLSPKEAKYRLVVLAIISLLASLDTIVLADSGSGFTTFAFSVDLALFVLMMLSFAANINR
jgi:hypothetical protein